MSDKQFTDGFHNAKVFDATILLVLKEGIQIGEVRGYSTRAGNHYYSMKINDTNLSCNYATFGSGNNQEQALRDLFNKLDISHRHIESGIKTTTMLLSALVVHLQADISIQTII
jgi:hypothetical protein